jgi:RNA polymerase sigma-70 factor (ECF subfamily)
MNDGTDSTFEVALEQVRPEALRFAYWLSRDRSVAEDVVQEAMLRAWRSRAALRDPRALRKWIFTICRREHARLYQRKRHETVDIDELPFDVQPVAHETDTAEIRQLREAIFALEDADREPLVMQVLLGYTTQEIADELEVRIGTVLTRLFRARQRLRKRLGIVLPQVDPDSPEEDSERPRRAAL